MGPRGITVIASLSTQRHRTGVTIIADTSGRKSPDGRPIGRAPVAVDAAVTALRLVLPG